MLQRSWTVDASAAIAQKFPTHLLALLLHFLPPRYLRANIKRRILIRGIIKDVDKMGRAIYLNADHLVDISNVDGKKLVRKRSNI